MLVYNKINLCRYLLVGDPQELAHLFTKVYLECIDETTSGILAKYVRRLKIFICNSD